MRIWQQNDGHKVIFFDMLAAFGAPQVAASWAFAGRIAEISPKWPMQCRKKCIRDHTTSGRDAIARLQARLRTQAFKHVVGKIEHPSRRIAPEHQVRVEVDVKRDAVHGHGVRPIA